MTKNNFLFFDLETGGLSGHRSSILSSSVGSTVGSVHSEYASPVSGSWISSWTAKHVWEPIQKSVEASKFRTERQLIEGMITQIETMGPGGVLAGWNIGYSPEMQPYSGKTVGAGFDLSMLRTRAEAYGLGTRLESAIQKIKVRDIGQEYAIKIAEEAVQFPELMDEKLFSEIEGYTKKIAQFRTARPGISNQELAQELATSGFRMLGWKLEDVHPLVFPNVVAPAHQSQFDVESTIRLAEHQGPVFTDPNQVSAWAAKTRTRMLVNSAIVGDRYTFDEIVSAAKNPVSKTGEVLSSLEKSFQNMLQETITSKGISLSDVVQKTGDRIEKGSFWKGSLLEETNFHFGSKQGLRDLASAAVSTLKKHKTFYGIAGGLLGLSLVDPLSVFSGKDDEYNVIEGLKHGGLAEQKRREMTDFGSGWQGMSSVPEQLMGISIDPRIREFRANVWDDPELRKEVERDIRKKESAQQATLGSFADTDYHSVNLSALEGINRRNSTLKAINLERFNIEIDDADTLVLKQKGAGAWFKNLIGLNKDIQVRLSGFDAPEVASHSNDPIADYRIFQEQLLGKESGEYFRQLLASQNNLTLVVSEGRKTYGRYLGAVFGDNNRNLGLDLLRTGAVAALPFGKSEEDIISRRAAAQAEQEAKQANKGIWSFARYRAIDLAHQQIGQDITFNTLTRLDKTSANLMLGAYTSYLETFGAQQRDLSTYEVENIKRLGKKLRKTHGPGASSFRKKITNRFSGKDDEYNTIEGLGHKGIAWQKRQEMTNFGSGYRGLIGLPTILGKMISQRGMSMTPQRLEQFLVEQVETSAASSIKNRFLKPFRMRAIRRVVEQAKLSPFEEVAVINPYAIRESAKKTNISYSRALKGTIAHERFHQRIQRSGLREELSTISFSEDWVQKIKQIHSKAKDESSIRSAAAEEMIASALEEKQLGRQLTQESTEQVDQVLNSYYQDVLPALRLSEIGNPVQYASLDKIVKRRELHKEGLKTATSYSFNPGSRHRQKKY